MIKKFFSKVTNFFVSTKQELKNVCEHTNKISKKVKYCADCKLVLDES